MGCDRAHLGDPLIAVKVARTIVSTGQAGLFELLGLLFGEGYEAVTREVEGGWEVGRDRG